MRLRPQSKGRGRTQAQEVWPQASCAPGLLCPKPSPSCHAVLQTHLIWEALAMDLAPFSLVRQFSGAGVSGHPQLQPPCKLLTSQPSLLPALWVGAAPAHLIIHADPVQGDVDGEGRGVVVWHQRGLLVRLVADNKGQVELGLCQGSDTENWR